MPDLLRNRKKCQASRPDKALFSSWRLPRQKSKPATPSTNSWASTVPSSLSSLEGDAKTVRFASKDSRHKVPSLESMSLEEKEAVWYTPTERHAMRVNAERSAISVGTESDFAACVDKTFREARYLAVITLDENQAAAFMMSEKRVTRHCRSLLWSSSDLARDSIRGLEEWVVPKQSRFERGEDAKESRAVVLELSKSLKKRGWRFDDDKVADAYREMTRTAAIFARFLAVVDQQAAASESVEI